MKPILIPLFAALWTLSPAVGVAAEPAKGSSAAAARRGEIAVEITNLRPGGSVLVALFDDGRRFPSFKGQVAAKRVAVSNTRARAVFGQIPYGRYAVAVVHDRNDNGKLDTRLGLIPTEPIGFSNGATVSRFGPPSFDAAAFELGTQRRPISIAVD